jgi:hypothetical protein
VYYFQLLEERTQLMLPLHHATRPMSLHHYD